MEQIAHVKIMPSPVDVHACHVRPAVSHHMQVVRQRRGRAYFVVHAQEIYLGWDGDIARGFRSGMTLVPFSCSYIQSLITS
jgi:hypothetical protein